MASKGELIALRISTPQAAILRDMAIELDTSLSAIVRTAIRAHIRRYGKDVRRLGRRRALALYADDGNGREG